MKKIILTSFIISLLVLSLSGCQSSYNDKPILSDYSLIPANHTAGNKLVRSIEGLLSSRKVLAASFVNIDDLEISSSFGRISSQQVATQFLNAGYNIEEMQLRKNIYIKQQSGEFMLSRELKDISVSHSAQAVIVGTYAVGREYVYVTAKVISVLNNQILAAYDYQIQIDSDVMNLLGGQSKYRK